MRSLRYREYLNLGAPVARASGPSELYMKLLSSLKYEKRLMIDISLFMKGTTTL
jgi:hypothetical protein